MTINIANWFVRCQFVVCLLFRYIVFYQLVQVVYLLFSQITVRCVYLLFRGVWLCIVVSVSVSISPFSLNIQHNGLLLCDTAHFTIRSRTSMTSPNDNDDDDDERRPTANTIIVNLYRSLNMTHAHSFQFVNSIDILLSIFVHIISDLFLWISIGSGEFIENIEKMTRFFVFLFLCSFNSRQVYK